jgi:hypothetical protein
MSEMKFSDLNIIKILLFLLLNYIILNIDISV